LAQSFLLSPGHILLTVSSRILLIGDGSAEQVRAWLIDNVCVLPSQMGQDQSAAYHVYGPCLLSSLVNLDCAVTYAISFMNQGKRKTGHGS
jgi:hypothetical protein